MKRGRGDGVDDPLQEGHGVLEVEGDEREVGGVGGRAEGVVHEGQGHLPSPVDHQLSLLEEDEKSGIGSLLRILLYVGQENSTMGLLKNVGLGIGLKPSMQN